MLNKIYVKFWHGTKQLSTCVFLIYSLIAACELAIAKEPDIAESLNLIPLPSPPSIELPLTGFKGNQNNVNVDPEATKIADRVQELVNRYKSLQATGNNLNYMGSALSSAKQSRQKSPRPGTANSIQVKKKKWLPSHLAYLVPQAGSNTSSMQGLILAQSLAQKNDILEIKMRSIGTPRQIKVNSHDGVQNMMPQTTVSATVQDTDEQVARIFLNSYRGHLRLDDPDNELSLNRKEKDDLNRQHLRFNQHFNGLPVWPSELIAHLDAQGNVDLVDGAFIPTPRDLSIKPVLSAEEAIFAARTNLPGSENAKVNQPELIIYGAVDNPARLAWKIKLDVSIQSQFIVVVDAINAQILNTFNTVEHQNVIGSGVDLLGSARPLNVWQVGNLYYLDDTSKSMFDPTSTLPNPNTTRGAIIITDAKNQPPTNQPQNPPSSIYFVTSNSSNSGWLKDGVSAAFNFSKVYDYYFSRHARNSIDGQGGSISAMVRLGKNYSNAFWTTSTNSMSFGDAAPFAAALDVVAHEMTHGVTAHTAALIPGTQPGAMNEGFSDIFGSSVEAYVSGSTDWIMGTQLGAGNTLRNLKDPSHTITGECGQQAYPSKMSEYLNSSNDANGDYGGVHCNSTVLSHAYYLLAQGLANPIGIKDAERIFYRALTVHLTQQAQFIDARLACIQSATELFGSTSTQAVKTAQAFDAVEIVDTTSTPSSNPIPPVSGIDATLFLGYDSFNSYGRLVRRETALGDGALGTWLSTSAMAAARPSIAANGSVAVFVTADNDLCIIHTDGASSEDCLNIPGSVHSVAMSPDGEHFGFVILDAYGNPDNKITVIDLNTSSTHQYSLISPASEGQTTDSIEMADVMTFTSNNRFLIYDALNVIKLNDGSQISAWSIYAIDFVTGQTLLIVPPKPGYDIGFPAIGHTSDDYITFEALNQKTNQTTVVAGNLRTGKSVTAATINFASLDYAVPNFTGNDLAIIYSVPDSNTWTLHSINKQPLASDHVTPSGNAALWLSDADFAVNYRRGAYQKLTVSNSNASAGVVTTNIGGINCGNTCSMIYPKGTAVSLTAKANAGSTFASWGGACSGTGICMVNMGQDLPVTATFTKKAAIGVPAGISVPVSDTDGVYTVTWTASATTGVTYVLEEATNNTFSTGLRTAYTGTGLSVAITGRVKGVTYYYRVKATKTGFTSSAPRVAANGCRVPFLAGVPASITVPVSDADGVYTVTWTASATTGVTYVLEEATNNTFSTGLRTAYTGTGLSVAITGRVKGVTYYYRVKATKTGFTSSAPHVAANGCHVPFLAGVPASITVPVSDADGVYTVTWTASATTGVTYVLEEATNNTFSIGLRTAYTGTGLSAAITGRVKGVTYYYRVKATKTGFTSSAPRVAANGCRVPFLAGVPASITVPVSDADGVYTVTWTASATTGVTYVLEEATNNTFSTGLRTAYTGTGLSAAITGRVKGLTYYYRVKATKTGFTSIAPRVAVNGCRVG